ncbi:hypothetical protein LSH36_989g00001 [Paralvinella palmiformis]|uniref:Peptidyl-prolyl cis-trans isomerase n=1 Tax=Paralvinella palmiformis TaxID=53620 RepID=A0AAD9MQF8_9ANNE|nr:hypothetical protein LSH36_989g00001 [Paralvinella palmiformis]
MAGCDVLMILFAGLLSAVLADNYTVTDEAWLEFEIKDLDGPGVDYRGRVVVALFGETAPVTTLNFRSLAKGYRKGNRKLHYKNTIVHRVVPDFVIQMGDITTGDGTGGVSIYGGHFADEEFVLSHRSPGWVAMANTGPDSNGSQFYITLNKARWLDGTHLVFGKVISGFEVIRTIGDVEVDKQTSRPKKRIRIIDSGLNDLDKSYDLDEDVLDSTEDL